MEKHIIREHGVVYRKNYSKLSPRIQEVEKTVRKRGQTRCESCGAFYNNRTKPIICICGNDLSRVCLKAKLNSFKLTEDLFSVRKHPKGISKRVVVDLGQSLCFSEDCMVTRAHYQNPSEFQCDHLKACSESSLVQQAPALQIDIETISKFIKNEETTNLLRKKGNSDGSLTVYQLPDNCLAVPLLEDLSHECTSGFLHVELKRLKCPLKKCSAKPRYHYLVKTKLMCIHILICKIAKNEVSFQPRKALENAPLCKPQFSKLETVQNVIDNISRFIPSPLHVDREREFLQQSTRIQQKLLVSPELTQFEETFCMKCRTKNILRKNKYRY